MIPVLLIVVVVLLLFRGRRSPALAPDSAISARDPIRLILWIVIILLVIGMAASLFMPLGNYRF
jgi:hypothetical protein